MKPSSVHLLGPAPALALALLAGGAGCVDKTLTGHTVPVTCALERVPLQVLEDMDEDPQYWPLSVRCAFGSGVEEAYVVVEDPDGELDSQRLGDGDAFVVDPEKVGQYTVYAITIERDVADPEASVVIDGEDEQLLFTVSPAPDCRDLFIPSLAETEVVQPGQVYDADNAQMFCSDEVGNDLGEVYEVELFLTGGHFNDTPGLDACTPGGPRGCSITVDGAAADLVVRGEGLLVGENGDAYEVTYDDSIDWMIASPPEISCDIDNSILTVSDQYNEVDIRVDTFSASEEVQVVYLITGHEAENELDSPTLDEVELARVSLGDGETDNVDISPFPTLLGAGGGLLVTATATSDRSGLTSSCDVAREIHPIDVNGNRLYNAWPGSYVTAPDYDFDLTGPWELRFVITDTDESTNPKPLFRAATASAELLLVIDGEDVILTYTGDGSDVRLTSRLSRLEGGLYQQEIRVSRGGSYLELAVDNSDAAIDDGDGLDLSDLADAEVTLAMGEDLYIHGLMFTPSTPRACLPWSGECEDLADLRSIEGEDMEFGGALCAGFDGTPPGTYEDTFVEADAGAAALLLHGIFTVD